MPSLLRRSRPARSRRANAGAFHACAYRAGCDRNAAIERRWVLPPHAAIHDPDPFAGVVDVEANESA